MKRSILVILLISICFFCHSQDTLVLRSGAIIKAKVIEVDADDIRYLKFGYDNPLYVIKKTDVARIDYQNGNRDVFSKNNTLPMVTVTDTPKSGKTYVDGMREAHMYYLPQTGGPIGTAITSVVFSPFLGVIPAVICASVRPPIRNLGIRDGSLVNNYDYMRGYEDEAFRIKKRKVWSFFGYGSAVYGVLLIIILGAHR